MGAQGTTTIDFGAFPGASDASVAVTGQGTITTSNLVEAWLYPVDTADHSADEHMLETIRVFAGNIVDSTGFTIYAFNTSEINEPLEETTPIGKRGFVAKSTTTAYQYTKPYVGGQGTRIYGTWTVAWVWN